MTSYTTQGAVGGSDLFCSDQVATDTWTFYGAYTGGDVIVLNAALCATALTVSGDGSMAKSFNSQLQFSGVGSIDAGAAANGEDVIEFNSSAKDTSANVVNTDDKFGLTILESFRLGGNNLINMDLGGSGYETEAVTFSGTVGTAILDPTGTHGVVLYGVTTAQLVGHMTLTAGVLQIH